MADTVYVGTRVTLHAVFTAAPSEVALSVREPDGTVSAYRAGQDAEVRDLGDGVTFELDWITRREGLHSFVAEGAGAAVVTGLQRFTVAPLGVPRALAT